MPDQTDSSAADSEADLAGSHLAPIGARIRADFEAKYAAREVALRLAREVIQGSATAIRAIHRHEFPEALRRLRGALDAMAQAQLALADHPDVYHAGFVHDAAKELAEAALTYGLVQGAPLPSPEALGVSYAAYLNGLGEAAGELRRHLLDYLRRGDVGRCERLLEAMDEIYSLLVTLDYPDAMTGGLRRTTDVTRGILEKTRGDFTAASRQRDLEVTLRAFEARFATLPPAAAGPEPAAASAPGADAASSPPVDKEP